MTTTPLIDPRGFSTEQEEAAPLLEAVREQLGFIPDGLLLYSISPPLLQSFLGTVGYFRAHRRLSQALLALIRYLVSSGAGCRFCIDFNAAILEGLGIGPEALEAARKDPATAPLDEDEKVLLEIALHSAADPESVGPSDVARAKAAGWTERDLFEVVLVAASNRAFTQVLRTFNVDTQGAFA